MHHITCRCPTPPGLAVPEDACRPTPGVAMPACTQMHTHIHMSRGAPPCTNARIHTREPGGTTGRGQGRGHGVGVAGAGPRGQGRGRGGRRGGGRACMRGICGAMPSPTSRHMRGAGEGCGGEGLLHTHLRGEGEGCGGVGLEDMLMRVEGEEGGGGHG